MGEEMEACETEFGKWLEDKGGGFSKRLVFKQNNYGFSLHNPSSASLPPRTTVVTCPSKVAITPMLARTCLARLGLGQEAETGVSKREGPEVDQTPLGKWTDHQLVCTYVAFHNVAFLRQKITRPEVLDDCLQHRPYIENMPCFDPTIGRPITSSEHTNQSPIPFTPLYWTDTELELLKGTNLYGATIQRKKKWSAEWEVVRAKILSMDLFESEGDYDFGIDWKQVFDEFDWPLYRYACTMLSSRSFPSTLIQDYPSKESTPVLLPGLDSLDHRRGSKVTWETDNSAVAIVLEDGLAASEEACNNYGAKPTDELILGYGFCLPLSMDVDSSSISSEPATVSNPDDTLVLRITIPYISDNIHDLACDEFVNDRNDAFSQWMEKARQTPEEKASDEDLIFTITRNGKIPQRLIGILRLLIILDDIKRIDEADEQEIVDEYGSTTSREDIIISILKEYFDDSDSHHQDNWVPSEDPENSNHLVPVWGNELWYLDHDNEMIALQQLVGMLKMKMKTMEGAWERVKEDKERRGMESLAESEDVTHSKRTINGGEDLENADQGQPGKRVRDEEDTVDSLPQRKRRCERREVLVQTFPAMEGITAGQVLSQKYSRPQILDMAEYYIRGQKLILEASIENANKLLESETLRGEKHGY